MRDEGVERRIREDEVEAARGVPEAFFKRGGEDVHLGGCEPVHFS